MEKAILKTLIYADIFDYPMKVWEIHKWLIFRKVSLFQVEKVMKKLVQSGQCKVESDYYFLSKRAGLVGKRKRRQKQSIKYLRKAQVLSSLLKLIPWIKLVGISGGLAMGNVSKSDDIDWFIITSKNRLWISRLFTLGILSLLGQRRKVGEIGGKIAGKLCINTLLEEDKLAQSSKDIYLAHEVLQMRPLWYRDGIYQKYLQDNEWVFNYIPNWVGPQVQSVKFKVQNDSAKLKVFDYLETLAKWIQLKIMGKPQGMERIEDRALYFHPNDIRPQVLLEYKRKVKKLAGLDN